MDDLILQMRNVKANIFSERKALSESRIKTHKRWLKVCLTIGIFGLFAEAAIDFALSENTVAIGDETKVESLISMVIRGFVSLRLVLGSLGLVMAFRATESLSSKFRWIPQVFAVIASFLFVTGMAFVAINSPMGKAIIKGLVSVGVMGADNTASDNMRYLATLLLGVILFAVSCFASIPLIRTRIHSLEIRRLQDKIVKADGFLTPFYAIQAGEKALVEMQIKLQELRKPENIKTMLENAVYDGFDDYLSRLRSARPKDEDNLGASDFQKLKAIKDKQDATDEAGRLTEALRQDTAKIQLIIDLAMQNFNPSTPTKQGV